MQAFCSTDKENTRTEGLQVHAVAVLLVCLPLLAQSLRAGSIVPHQSKVQVRRSGKMLAHKDKSKARSRLLTRRQP